MKIGIHLALAIGLLASPDQLTFQSVVDLVVIPVTLVSNTPPGSIEDVPPDGFRVFEDGVRQDVEVVHRETGPLSVCIVLDRSNSMEPLHRQYAHAAIEAVLEGLGPGDEAALLVFAGKLDIALPWTVSEALPRISWSEWPAADDTSLYDAAGAALRMLDGARNKRSVVLLVSDGADSSSRLSLKELAATRRQSEATVFAFHAAPWVMAPATGATHGAGGIDSAGGLEAAADDRARARAIASARSASLSALATLVGDGGGTLYTLRVSDDAARAAQLMLGELRNQYTIGYRPAKAMDGKYRRIKVELVGRKASLRHRKGYLAQPAGPKP